MLLFVHFEWSTLNPTFIRFEKSSSRRPRTVTRVWIVTRHMKGWQMGPKYLEGPACCCVSVQPLIVPHCSSSQLWMLHCKRGKENNLTAHMQESKSSHLAWGKIGKVMRLNGSARQSRPRGTVKDDDRETNNSTDTKKLNVSQVLQHI